MAGRDEAEFEAYVISDGGRLLGWMAWKDATAQALGNAATVQALAELEKESR